MDTQKVSQSGFDPWEAIMSRKITTLVYVFDELGEAAQEKARDWYRDGALDYDWWKATVDDFLTIAEHLGYSIGNKQGHKEVWFSGFASQGNGACFEGYWYGVQVDVEKLDAHTGRNDPELNDIAAALAGVAEADSEACASLTHRGNYYHEMTIDFGCDGMTAIAEEAFIEASRDLMRWLYRTLESEHDYLLSDECVDESILANGYEFEESGERA